MQSSASIEKSTIYHKLVPQLANCFAQLRASYAWRRSACRVIRSNPFFSQLNPCIVDGRPTLIFPAQLDGLALRQLDCQVSEIPGGWRLLRDRRSGNEPVVKERRAWKLAAVFQGLLGMSLLPSTAGADAERIATMLENPNHPIESRETQHRSLALLMPVTTPEPDHKHRIAPSPSMTSGLISGLDAHRHDQRTQDVLELLLKKWRGRRSAPDFVATDIKQIAAYIAARDEAYDLLMRLKRQPWNWVYQPGEFRSEVKGSRLSVNSVNVYFDTRSAARFTGPGNCSPAAGHTTAGHASSSHCELRPVDALLHELLHVRAALLDTRAFLRSGAMAGGSYPHRHEREILSQERELFSAMSAQDSLPRPQRNRHSGQIIAAECATCLGG